MRWNRCTMLFAALLFVGTVAAREEYWVERGSNATNLTNWLLIVTAQGDPPSSETNDGDEFIVSWNGVMIDYLGLLKNSSQITTEINTEASDPWVFESTIDDLNASQGALLNDLQGDDCQCWDQLEAAIDNETNTNFRMLVVSATRLAGSSSVKSSGDDDKFGTGEIVGIVFGVLLIYYCCFMVAAGIFYLTKALVKKARRHFSKDESEDLEELDDLGKDRDSETSEGTFLEEEDSSSEEDSDSDTGLDSSGVKEDSETDESSTKESSSEETSS